MEFNPPGINLVLAAPVIVVAITGMFLMFLELFVPGFVKRWSAWIALIGLAIVTTAAKRQFLLPKNPWNFPDKSQWPKTWMGSIEISSHTTKANNPISTFMAWIPYLLVAGLLVISRVPQLPFKSLLTNIKIGDRLYTTSENLDQAKRRIVKTQKGLSIQKEVQ